jgi:WD40 repeat protein
VKESSIVPTQEEQIGMHPQSVASNSRWLAVGDVKGKVHIWQFALDYDLKPLTEIKPSSSGISALAWFGEKRLIVGGDDGAVMVLEVALKEDESLETRILLTLNGQLGARVRSIAVSPDGRLLATGSDVGRLMVYDLEFGHLLASFMEPSTGSIWITDISFSPYKRPDEDQWLVAATFADGSWRCWSLERRQCVFTEQPSTGSPDSLWALRWSPDGRLLTTVSEQGHITLYNVNNNKGSK